jgi:hypothetical protein
VFDELINHSTDFDKIWYRDRLDLGEGHSLPIFAKKVKASKPDKTQKSSSCLVVAIKTEKT